MVLFQWVMVISSWLVKPYEMDWAPKPFSPFSNSSRSLKFLGLCVSFGKDDVCGGGITYTLDMVM